MTPQTRSILVFLVIGGGLLRNLIVGVIGAFVGGYLFSALNIRLGIKNEFLRQIVTATAGAIVIVLLARLIA